MSNDDASVAILALLANREPEATVCPSEVARKIAAQASSADWRATMPAVHAAVDGLVKQKQITISWKGRRLPKRAGPYRIGAPIGG